MNYIIYTCLNIRIKYLNAIPDFKIIADHFLFSQVLIVTILIKINSFNINIIP